MAVVAVALDALADEESLVWVWSWHELVMLITQSLDPSPAFNAEKGEERLQRLK